jgi:hypothetical protein
LMTSCAVQGPAYEPVAVAPEQSVIYVYRTYPTLAYGAGVLLPVACGENSILLGPGGYHVFKVGPGEILCSSHLENTANLDIHAQPGQNYYIRGWPSMGILLPRTNLELMDAQSATTEISECKKQ